MKRSKLFLLLGAIAFILLITATGIYFVGTRICLGSGYGYVDQAGKFVIPPKYALAMPFKNGRAEVWEFPPEVNDNTTLLHKIDTKGRIITTTAFNYDGNGEEMKWNWYDGESAPSIKSSKFNALELRLGKNNNEFMYGLANTSGKWVIPPMYNDISHFYDGIAYVCYGKSTTGCKWGTINTKNQFVLKPICSIISHYHDGLAVCKVHFNIWGQPEEAY